MLKRDAFAINWSGGTLAGLVTQERHDRPVLVSAHPVDSGAPVTDHVRTDQDVLGLAVLFTNAPITWGAKGAGWVVTPLDISPQLPVALVSKTVPLSPREPTPVFSPGIAVAGAVTGAINLIGGLAGVGPDASVFASGTAKVPNAVDSVQAGNWGGVDFVAESWDALNQIRNTAEIIQVVTGLETYDGMIIRRLGGSRSPDSTALSVELELVRLRKASTRSVSLPKVKKRPAAPRKDAGKAKTETPTIDNRSMALKIANGLGLLE